MPSPTLDWVGPKLLSFPLGSGSWGLFQRSYFMFTLFHDEHRWVWGGIFHTNFVMHS